MLVWADELIQAKPPPCPAIIAVFLIESSAQQTNLPSEASIHLTPERAVKLRRPSALHFSPDGARLICVVSEFRESAMVWHLWLLEMSRGELRQFTFSQKSERSPQWSPDGKVAWHFCRIVLDPRSCT